MGTYDSEELVGSGLLLDGITTGILELSDEKVLVILIAMGVVIVVKPSLFPCEFTAVHRTRQRLLYDSLSFLRNAADIHVATQTQLDSAEVTAGIALDGNQLVHHAVAGMIVVLFLGLRCKVVLDKGVSPVEGLHFENLNAGTQFGNRILCSIVTIADKDVRVDNLFEPVKT